MLVQYSEAVIWKYSLKESVLKIFSKFTGKQLVAESLFQYSCRLKSTSFWRKESLREKRDSFVKERKVCER